MDRNIVISNNILQGTQTDGINCATDPGIGTADALVISGNVIEDCGRDGVSRAGILVARYDDVIISNNRINGKLNTFLRYGIQLVTVVGGAVTGNRVEDLNGAAGTNGGIFWTSCTVLKVQGNSIKGVAGNNLWSATSTDDQVFDNDTDDTTVVLGTSPFLSGNQLGTTTTPFRWYVAGVEVLQVNLSGNLVFSDAKNIVFNATTGTKIGTATTEKLSFWNATPVARGTAFTQTFATADKIHAARTALTLTDNTAGTANTTLQALPDPADTPATADALRDDLVANLIPALRNDLADLAASNNALIADLADTAAFANSIVDELQSIGLFA